MKVLRKVKLGPRARRILRRYCEICSREKAGRTPKPPGGGPYCLRLSRPISYFHELECYQIGLANSREAEQETHDLAQRLATLLTRTANALKGKPAPLVLHSWHDLPRVARDLRRRAGARR